MLKKDLDNPKLLTGIIEADRDNLEVYFIDKKSNREILLTDGTKFMFEGMLDAEYKNIESIGFFRSNMETKTVCEVENINNFVYLKKLIEPDFKEFLKNYINSDILSFLEQELKEFEVTLYDCTFFKSHKDLTEENYINGTNLIQFESNITFGYCYLIHKFRIDESIGLSIVNNFEFISDTGDKKTYFKTVEIPKEEVQSEEQEIEKQFLDYYESNYKQID